MWQAATIGRMSLSARKTLETLGYADVPKALHRAQEDVPRQHPYALEMRKVFEASDALPDGASVLGVYEIEGVPAVCLVEGRPGVDVFEDLRSRLWNQGLISLVLVVGADAVQAMPVGRKLQPATPVPMQQVTRESPYSAYGVSSGALKEAHGSWFEPEARVDRFLLRNIEEAIRLLREAGAGFSHSDAQHLVGQAMFVAYLEDRELITAAFRREHDVRTFIGLLKAKDGVGMDRLLSALKNRFNGDFLSPDETRARWSRYPATVFDILSRFLAREDLQAGQTSAWPYDFSQIPVELLSGIYETFLGERKKTDAAYYTPRHLANLAIDELFRGIERPDLEIVWDGTCGSGILLTTAFRRMLGAAEVAKGSPLTFTERSKLLTSRIFGGDINLSACQVTAFSLYLCLLEDLASRPRADMRLPHLLDRNIFTPNSHGDAFSPEHPIVTGAMPRPTCVASNPPWREPKAEEGEQSADRWAAANGLKVSLRQIALTYAQLTSQRAAAGARIVLILPGSAFLREQPHEFVRQWLGQVQLERLINFADLRNVLFPGAKHPCVVAVVRNQAPELGVPHSFDYVTPKADAALHYNRLTIYAADRRRLDQGRVRIDASAIRSLYWCSELEIADIAKLRLCGTMEDLKQAGKLISGTGFHVTDLAKKTPMRPGWLAKIPHVSTTDLPSFGPARPDSNLTPWPNAYQEIAGQGRRELYEGPRVIVPNGMTPSHRIRAFAVDAPGSVNNSCSVLRPVDGDSDTAFFLAAYLSSRLAAYLAMVLAPSAVTERTQIKHGELLSLPFVLPGDHQNRQLAGKCVRKVADYVRQGRAFALTSGQNDLPPEIEQLVRTYFGVGETLGQVIDEVAEQVLPNMQPTTIAKLPGPLQVPPVPAQMERYANALATELASSRDALGGSGRFQVSLTSWRAGAAGGIGMVRVSVEPGEGANEVQIGTAAAQEVLRNLDQRGLLNGVTQGGLSLVGDTLIRQKNAIYFAKPLVNRLWLTSAALDDALRIVRHVHEAPR